MKTVLTAIIAVFVVASVLPVSAESPDETYSFAKHLQRDGLYEAAAQQFLKFARENPNDRRAPEALFTAAQCLTDADNPDNAVAVLESLVETYPDHPEQCRYQVQLGRVLYKLGRYDAADRAFTSVIVTMPDCALVPDAMLGKGEALISLNNYVGAREILSAVVRDHIESKAAPRASYNLAFCLKELGRETEALRTYEKLVAQFPGDPLAGFGALEAARMNVARGDAERAIQYYTLAKQFETNVFFVPAATEGAQLLDVTGKPELALQWYEELLMRDGVDDRRRVHIEAVDVALRAGDLDAVRRLADSYEKKYPSTFAPQIVFTDALASLEKRDYDRVERNSDRLERFAAGTEWARSALRLRGEALLGRGRPREAVAQLDQFVTLSSDSASRVQVLNNIADVSMTMTADTTMALDAMMRMLDVERRQNVAEIQRVASAHETAGRYGAARALYADVVKRFPLSQEAGDAQKRIDYLDELTVTNYRVAAQGMDAAAYRIATNPGGEALLDLAQARIDALKDFGGALAICKQMEKATENTPAHARVLYLTGECHDKLARVAQGRGDDKRAKDHMKKALEPWKELDKKFANSPWAARAAFDREILTAEIEGRFDVGRANAALEKYPQSDGALQLLVRMGDHFAAMDGDDNTARAIYYYQRARQLNDSAALQLKAAMALSRQGKQKEALSSLERIARENDGRDGLRAAYEAGRALRELERYREAVPYFDRVAAADPGGSLGSTAAMQAADCYYMQRQFEEALSRYRIAERTTNSDARKWDVSYRTALCLRQTGDYEGALDRFEKLIASEHGGATRAQAYKQAAETAQTVGDDERRLAILESYVKEFRAGDSFVSASKELARAYLAEGRGEDAYRTAAALDRAADKKDAEPKALMAMALYQQGKSGEAEALAGQVGKMVGQDAPLVREIGVEAARFHYDRKEYKQAVSSIRAFAESCSGEGPCEEARYVYAMSLFADRQIDKGNAVAQSFFRDYPLSTRSPVLHLRMGNMLTEAGRTNEALLHYQEAVETARDTTVAFTAMKNLGVTYQRMERWKDAEQVWTKMLGRIQQHEYASEAALNVARCKMEQGNYKGAIVSYEESMPLLDSEAKARAFYWMGTSYEQLGDYQSAVVEYLKVPYLASGGGMWIVTAQLKAADCYVKLKRVDAARDIYNKVIQSHGANSNWGKIAQKGLDELGDNAQSGGGQQ